MIKLVTVFRYCIKFDSSGKALCGSIVNAGADDIVAESSDPTGQYVYLGGDLATSGNVVFGPDVLNGFGEVPFVARWEPCDVTVGEQEIDEINNVKLFPNPSTGIFNFELHGVNTKAEIAVYNMLGEKVYSKLTMDNSQLTINLSEQPSGIYLYRIISESGIPIGQGKLIKE